MGHIFPKTLRLRKTWEFKRAWKVGCKLHTPHFILLRLETTGSFPRLGLTVSRKVGNSVQRNRLKRLIREYFRNNQHRFGQAVDYSIVAKKGAADLSVSQVFSELERAMK